MEATILSAFLHPCPRLLAKKVSPGIIKKSLTMKIHTCGNILKVRRPPHNGLITPQGVAAALRTAVVELKLINEVIELDTLSS